MCKQVTSSFVAKDVLVRRCGDGDLILLMELENSSGDAVISISLSEDRTW